MFKQAGYVDSSICIMYVLCTKICHGIMVHSNQEYSELKMRTLFLHGGLEVKFLLAYFVQKLNDFFFTF